MSGGDRVEGMTGIDGWRRRERVPGKVCRSRLASKPCNWVLRVHGDEFHERL